jgi:hypothetical protein
MHIRNRVTFIDHISYHGDEPSRSTFRLSIRSFYHLEREVTYYASRYPDPDFVRPILFDLMVITTGFDPKSFDEKQLDTFLKDDAINLNNNMPPKNRWIFELEEHAITLSIRYDPSQFLPAVELPKMDNVLFGEKDGCKTITFSYTITVDKPYPKTSFLELL